MDSQLNIPFQAHVIMVLAGSNGGSWSKSFSNSSALKPFGGESYEYIGSFNE